jgi:hypothetical protein
MKTSFPELMAFAFLLALIFQNVEAQEFDAEGARFLNSKMLAWENFLTSPVIQSGKFVEISGDQKVIFHIFEDRCLFVQEFSDYRMETIYNREHSATIRVNSSNASGNLTSYTSIPAGREFLPEVMGMCPFGYTSLLFRQFSVPEAIRNEKLAVIGFDSSQNLKRVKLVPNGEFVTTPAKLVELELSFQDDKPIPVGMRVLTEYEAEGNKKQIETNFRYDDFWLVHDLEIPNRLTIEILQNGKKSRINEQLKFEPGLPLELSRCQLSYYGMTAPATAQLESGRWDRKFIILGGILFLATLLASFYFRKRGQNE